MKSPQPRLASGFGLALLGVTLFSLTLPLTRQALAYWPWHMLSLGRSLVAGAVAVLLLLVTRSRWPQRQQWWPLWLTGLGVVIGFPVSMAVALQQLPSSHGAVVLGILPLVTALLASWRNHERASVGFWLCAVIGSALVVVFVLRQGGGQFHPMDALLLVAVFSAAFGYVEGAKLTVELGGWQTIAWALVLQQPLLLALFLSFPLPHFDVPPLVWANFLYLSLVSQLLGFVPWYAGLRRGGAARMGQVQLLQVFFTLGFGWLILGESLSTETWVFAALVALSVGIGRQLGSR